MTIVPMYYMMTAPAGTQGLQLIPGQGWYSLCPWTLASAEDAAKRGKTCQRRIFKMSRVWRAECRSSIILVEAGIHASAKSRLGEGCHGILKVFGFLNYLAISYCCATEWSSRLNFGNVLYK